MGEMIFISGRYFWVFMQPYAIRRAACRKPTLCYAMLCRLPLAGDPMQRQSCASRCSFTLRALNHIHWVISLRDVL